MSWRPCHVPGELHKGAGQQEGVVYLLAIEVWEDCGQTRADIVHDHVLGCRQEAKMGQTFQSSPDVHLLIGGLSRAQPSYLSEDDVKGENLEEEVRGDRQDLLLFFVLLHDVAVGRVVKVQPANTGIFSIGHSDL